MRETFTSGSVGGLVWQQLILPGKRVGVRSGASGYVFPSPPPDPGRSARRWREGHGEEVFLICRTESTTRRRLTNTSGC